MTHIYWREALAFLLNFLLAVGVGGAVLVALALIRAVVLGIWHAGVLDGRQGRWSRSDDEPPKEPRDAP